MKFASVHRCIRTTSRSANFSPYGAALKMLIAQHMSETPTGNCMGRNRLSFQICHVHVQEGILTSSRNHRSLDHGPLPSPATKHIDLVGWVLVIANLGIHSCKSHPISCSRAQENTSLYPCWRNYCNYQLESSSALCANKSSSHAKWEGDFPVFLYISPEHLPMLSCRYRV